MAKSTSCKRARKAVKSQAKGKAEQRYALKTNTDNVTVLTTGRAIGQKLVRARCALSWIVEMERVRRRYLGR